MTRHAGYVVVLDHDLREEDSEGLLDAIRRLRGVLTVKPIESDCNLDIAEDRARHKLWAEVRQVFWPEKTGSR